MFVKLLPILTSKPISFFLHISTIYSDECPKGQTCHGGINQCNMIDLLQKEKNDGMPTPDPTPSPVSSDDPKNSKFVSTICYVLFKDWEKCSLTNIFFSYLYTQCGKSWQLANDNCSLETHCPT